MPGSVYEALYEAAADQYGFVRQADAKALGIPASRLVNLEKRGALQRRAYGLYRVTVFPLSQLDSYMEAALWPTGVRGVLSHETALELHGLSDVNPAKIHITVPPQHRVRREIPAQYVIHRCALDQREITLHEGIPTVSAERAIRDCHSTHLGPALISQAIDDAARRGLLTQPRAKQLRADLLHPAPS